MASKTFVIKAVDGLAYRMTRTVPQGRPVGTGVGCKARSYSATDNQECIISEKAKKAGMSKSAYIVMAAMLFELN